ncbi:putative lipid II flippase FtsW [Neobacillus vireti]|uniref:Probable peptidoglycan glycosyltransferase FtsW n=1 Tax=Neobacillus vireti LMG 21834 TaxID=1131730 RepID=A0AB94IQG5_9BACI|nr:putative lipid II flippase FtsW [Neobacillus vireti]ETI69299.1 cell division protein FtsW [Neobacillus vireti LMG 21834]KLT19864.1 cell division protein FtsW [Neobacillus vireti]
MDLKRLKKIDYLLVITAIFLCLFGLVMVYSASFPIASVDFHDSRYFYTKQLHSLGIGIVLMVITIVFPYRVYGKLSPILVVISIILLIMVLIPGFGVERNHSQRWLHLGPILIQPTEAIKLVMIIYFANVYAKKQAYIAHFWKGVMPPLFILAFVFLLILKQPDLGTATAILLPCGFILLCSGARIIHLILLGGIAVGGIGFFAISAPYRMNRILSFRNPFADPYGDGYQLISSYHAIASGGTWGKGLGHSIQKFGYLPEAHTDFIMAVILEELGIFGLMLVIFSYLFIMYRGVRIALNAKDPFAKLLAIGLTFQIMVQVIFNLAAVSGLLPITGVPLPFVSYGGSSLIFMLISLGILTNLSRRTKHKIPQVKVKKGGFDHGTKYDA